MHKININIEKWSIYFKVSELTAIHSASLADYQHTSVARKQWRYFQTILFALFVAVNSEFLLTASI